MQKQVRGEESETLESVRARLAARRTNVVEEDDAPVVTPLREEERYLLGRPLTDRIMGLIVAALPGALVALTWNTDAFSAIVNWLVNGGIVCLAFLNLTVLAPFRALRRTIALAMTPYALAYAISFGAGVYVIQSGAVSESKMPWNLPTLLLALVGVIALQCVVLVQAFRGRS